MKLIFIIFYLEKDQTEQFQNVRDALSSTINSISDDIVRIDQSLVSKENSLLNLIDSTNGLIKQQERETGDIINNINIETSKSFDNMKNENKKLYEKIGKLKEK